jgi:hypothetical protein
MEKTFTNSIRQLANFLLPAMLLMAVSSVAQLTWPSGQLLPSFPAPAKNQDLIYIRENSSRWEAEGASISHKTGHNDGDGWLCQTGIDIPNDHMVYGPYDNTIPAGPNVAEFRVMIDNNTADNNPQIDIDVRDATSGAMLASQTITRQQFPVAGSYTSFTLPFTMPADNHSLELRVYWRGGAYIKVDYVSVQQNSSTPQMYLFASLKGIINRTQPRIFSYEGDAFAEGPYTWLQSLGMTWTEYANNWDLITKYRSEIGGLIVYDPAQTATINLATMLAKDKKALVTSPALLNKLTSAPYNLPILQDLRGQFTSKLQVYQTIYNTYWPSLDHRLLISLNPDVHKAALREYAVATGLATVWLDPNVSGESELLNSFLSSMPANSNVVGWWNEEGSGVGRASNYGVATIASDWCSNLTMHSGTSRTVNLKPIPPKPTLQNKIYVAFIMSDGDNLQYVEHLMRKLWNNPDRGSVPMGWTISPSMIDAMPGALNFLYQTSTDNDNLISGPSGYGYAYPNNMNSTNLNQYVAKTEEYNRKAGLRVTTVWNTITGGINQNVGQAYATYAPSLLGVSAQNTGGPLTIYNNTLPGFPLSCNYCAQEQNVKDFIAGAAAGWNRAEPRFILIQAQPWQDMKPTNFKNVANSLNSDYIVVRPDHFFQLIREKSGLPIDPNPINGNGDGLTGNYFNGKNFDIPRLSRKDANVNFDWGTGSPDAAINVDQFSARWTGQIQPRYSGNYTFYITNDDGGRLWINNQLVIDKWYDDGGTVVSGTINLTAGQKYDIKLEYYENGGGAKTILEWSSGSQAIEIVPTSQLYSNPTPTVSITSPANNASFTAPASVTINANAGDNGSVAKVDFYNGTTLLGTDNSTPYSFSWNNVAVGSYSITAIATDNSGAFTISAPVAITVKQDQNNGTGDGLTGNYFNGMNFETPKFSRKDATISFDWGNGSPDPSVNADAFSARWTGQIQAKYSETYTFYLNTDNGRRLWINNQLIVDKWIDDWGVEYTGTIALTAGQKYEIKLEYFENFGGANCKLEWSSASQARQVIPQSQLYSNNLPAVAITSPTNNSSINGPANLNLAVNASDSDGSVSKVDYYNGSTLIASTTSPFTYAWNNVAVGTYSITAIAYDNRGGVTVSAPVSVAVKSATNQAPAVSITSPVNNSSYNAPASITFTANASDPDGSITKVEFFNGSSSIGFVTASPYNFTWTNVAAGTYTISAKATDNSNAITTSSSITIVVKSVNTNTCSGIAQYIENGGYVDGSKVQNGGSSYQCKPYPYTGWCNGAAWAYAPGTGAYWTDAWTLIGSCTASAATVASSNLLVPNPATDNLTININESSKITIYNSMGNIALPSTTVAANGTLNIVNLPGGIYDVRIETSSQIINVRLVKN